MTARLTAADMQRRSVVTSAGCWEYPGKAGNAGGYKQAAGDWAHRTAYRLFIGPIPDGFEVDHLCFNRVCVNPAHLEATTREENMRRAFAARTECGNGHLWDDENTRINPRGFRECRACHRDRENRRRDRIRAGLAAYVIRTEQHGTTTGYYYGCRCAPCRAAQSVKNARNKARRTAKALAELANTA